MPSPRNDILLCILPGLDGTDKLFQPFVDSMPFDQECRFISYPIDQNLGVDRLVELAEYCIPTERPVLLLGISFSGPVAIRLLERKNRNYVGAMFCTTFALPPRPFALRLSFILPIGTLGQYFSWRSILSFLFFDSGSRDQVVRALQSVIREVAPAVITGRLRELCRIDERDRLKSLDIPCCYLQAVHDRLVPSRSLRPFREFLSRLDVVRIDGPHALLQSRPAEVWSSVQRFIQSL